MCMTGWMQKNNLIHISGLEGEEYKGLPLGRMGNSEP